MAESCIFHGKHVMCQKMLVYNWRISYTQELSPSLGWPITWTCPDLCCTYIYVYINCQAEALVGGCLRDEWHPKLPWLQFNWRSVTSSIPMYILTVKPKSGILWDWRDVHGMNVIPNYLGCNSSSCNSIKKRNTNSKLPWLQLRKRSKFHAKFVGHLDPQLIKRKEGQMKKGVFILTASKGIRMLKLVTWKKLSFVLNAFIFSGNLENEKI